MPVIFTTVASDPSVCKLKTGFPGHPAMCHCFKSITPLSSASQVEVCVCWDKHTFPSLQPSTTASNFSSGTQTLSVHVDVTSVVLNYLDNEVLSRKGGYTFILRCKAAHSTGFLIKHSLSWLLWIMALRKVIDVKMLTLTFRFCKDGEHFRMPYWNCNYCVVMQLMKQNTDISIFVIKL